MYKLSGAQEGVQGQRLRGLDFRLQIAYLQAFIWWLLKYPNGHRPIITDGYRDDDEQAELYAQGRTTPGPIVTYKLPGQSKHNRTPAQALDIGFLNRNGQLDWNPAIFQEFAQLVKKANGGVKWGGDWPDWKDRPHFEV